MHLKNEDSLQTWSIEKSKALYGVDNWGAGYFNVNQKGNAVVTPDGPDGPQVDLRELVNSLVERDIELPVLFRFNGILRHRIHYIYQAFQNAIEGYNYSGKFYPAYPIKVNQQRHIVDVICEAGNQCNMGLEVGSKPELIAILALHNNPNALLLCNGYKDRTYIELALLSQKVGRRPIIIIEKFSELALVLQIAEELGVEPEVGFRLRLSGKGSGRWERSGGDRAKFGLTVAEILKGVELLEEHGKTDALKLIHFHVGSQLTAISSLREALKEAMQVYIQLKKICTQLSFIDVGGGLGVDYDGSQTTFASSMNYSVAEYARDVVWIIEDLCERNNTERPNIVTESGRATVAYHSVLVFDVLGIANTFDEKCDLASVRSKSQQSSVLELADMLQNVTPKNCIEFLHDANMLRGELLQQFNLGLISIQDRALGDQVYWALLHAISEQSTRLHYIPEDLEKLPELLSDTYFCNLSVFQSIPDSWAIQQIFPIIPIARLNEKPDRPVVLADITCDSDGKVDRFPDLKDVKRYLPSHALKEGEPYYYAAFLVGAYQEILGDLHNLFGDTNAVHVEVDEKGTIEFSNIVYGDDVSEVLHYVQYDKQDLCNRWRAVLEHAVSNGSISATETADLYKRYARSFEGYTYLTAQSSAS